MFNSGKLHRDFYRITLAMTPCFIKDEEVDEMMVVQRGSLIALMRVAMSNESA